MRAPAVEVGRNHERTERRARAFGASPYIDIDEMLERERPDLVSLCLPNEGHFEPTLKVIRAGFPLFVEKPFVFDLDEADILLREAEARALFFAINFNHRYATPVAMAADAVRAGALDELARDAPPGWRPVPENPLFLGFYRLKEWTP